MQGKQVKLVSRRRLHNGMVQVFTGDGKGKTSAALGAALRASGHNMRVCVIQFMKGGFPYGEKKAIRSLPNVKLLVFGFKTFVDPNNVKEEERAEGRKALDTARLAINSGDYDVVILDEINVASAWKLIEEKDLVSMLLARPTNVEVILTGRYASPRLLDLADLVTIMVKVKHPFDRGVKSRKGIEY